MGADPVIIGRLADRERCAGGIRVVQEPAAGLACIDRAQATQRHLVAGQRFDAITGRIARGAVSDGHAVLPRPAAGEHEHRLPHTEGVVLPGPQVPGLLRAAVERNVEYLAGAIEVPPPSQ